MQVHIEYRAVEVFFVRSDVRQRLVRPPDRAHDLCAGLFNQVAKRLCDEEVVLDDQYPASLKFRTLSHQFPLGPIISEASLSFERHFNPASNTVVTEHQFCLCTQRVGQRMFDQLSSISALR
ncbi:hypothetical protein LMG28727_07759 [Paraburkholderia kirstenboschensis]|nr:hypothetical protein LMG28727_07759 [Paraburkholderia kirstenboschensis]